MQQSAQGGKRSPEQSGPTSHPSKRQKCDGPLTRTRAVNDQTKAEKPDIKVESALNGAASPSDSEPEITLSDITKTHLHTPAQLSHATKDASTDANAPYGTPAHTDEAQTEAIRLEYGLFRVPPLPHDDETWLGCKFCPKFGCLTRKKNYFMLFRSPFDETYIIKHLCKEHPTEWQQFSKLDKVGKEALFGHVTLPGRRKMVKRAQQLYQSWFSGTGPQGVGQKRRREIVCARVEKGDTKKMQEKENLAKDGAIEEMGEVCERTVSYRSVSGSTLVSSDEQWAGRRLYRRDGMSEVGGRDETVNQADGGLNHQMAILSLESYFGCVREISLDLKQVVLFGVFNDKHVRPYLPECTSFIASHHHEPGQIAPTVESDLDDKMKHLRRLYVFVLYHLLRGVSVDVISKLAAEAEHAYNFSREKVTNANTTSTDEKVVREPIVQCVTPIVGAESCTSNEVEGKARTTPNHEGNNANMSGRKLIDFIRLKEKLVWDCGNSVCVEALQLLREALNPSGLNWALLLTTRRCEELDRGAVEFLIQVRIKGGVIDWIHLVSVLDTQDSGKAVMEVLDSVVPDWPRRLVGLKSGLETTDVEEKKLEESVVIELRKNVEVQDSLHYVGKEEVHPSVDNRSVTGLELAALIHANKKRYCESVARQQEVKKMLDTLQAEEKCLQTHMNKVFNVHTKQDEEMMLEKFPCTLKLVTFLNELWAYPLPISGAVKARLRIGWFDKHMTMDGMVSHVVNPLLERVLVAREFVRLHSLLSLETSVGSCFTGGAR